MTHDIVFDLKEAAPDVFAALEREAPRAVAALDDLRRNDIPLMPNSAPGEHGRLYRMKGHNRSVCLALDDDKATADVIVLKGSEPLLADFDAYLHWMTGTQFGAWPRPLAEHFPLFEGKAPGTVHLAEAMGEAAIALDAQQRHLAHYGGLMRLPVPLLVWKLRGPDAERVVATLRARISTMAFERLEPHLAHGIGVLAYYCCGDDEGARETVVPETIAIEGALFRDRLQSPEAKEAFSAFLQKRKPDFSKF